MPDIVTTEFAALTNPLIADVIRTNVGAQGITPSNLQRIKIPAGGGTAWKLDTLEGIKHETKISGVVILAQPRRSYWKDEFDGSGASPDCYSLDAEAGVGSPGGRCVTCDFAAFGSGKGNAQACKMVMELYVLLHDQSLPAVLQVSPGSLKEWHAFMMKLGSAGLLYYLVSINIGLKEAASGGGIKYSQLDLSLDRRLDGDEVAAVIGYRQTMLPMLSSMRFDDENE